VEKKKAPPESSIALRVICCLMAIIAITASFIFGESAVPVIQFDPMQMAVLVLCVWLCIGGGVFSYHYMLATPPVVTKLIKLGVLLIVVNLTKELWIDNLYALQFQFLRPLMHSLVATSVLTSFELRTRSDIIASATFGLLLLCIAATSGKSMLFGGIVFLYICLGGVLLMLSCQSQARNEATQSEQPTFIKRTTQGTTNSAVALTILLLPLISIALFCIIPRLDNEADSVSARVRASATATIYEMRKNQTVNLLPNQDPIARSPGPNQLDGARRREAARRNKVSQKTTEHKTDPSPPKKKNARSSATPTVGNDNTHKHRGGKTPTAANKRPHDLKQSKASMQRASNQPKKGEKASTIKGTKTGTIKETTKPSVSSAETETAKASKNGADPKDSAMGGEKSKVDVAPQETANKARQNETSKNRTEVLDESSISLSQAMKDPEEPMFSLACTRKVYTKFMAMDTFNGRKWSRKGTGNVWEFDPNSNGVALECAPLKFSYAVPIMDLVQTYKVESNLGYYVPVAGIPQHLSLLQRVTVDAFGSIKASNPLLAGTNYSVLAQLPVYALDDMRTAKPVTELEPDGIDNYLEIPDNQSQKLFQLSSELAGEDGNRFRRAERLLLHLRKSYAYSIQPVDTPPGTNFVDAFLFDAKKGDCKAFASAFVMMCRAVEIPARFVAGYLPGDFDPVTGATHVKRKHSHAWAEVYMPPYGWVPFDPTPGGQLPSRPEESYYNYQRIQREITAYTDKAKSSSVNAVTTALSWVGKILGAISLAVAAFALYLGLQAANGVIRTAIHAMAHRHPATKMKDRIVKSLTKFGVAKTPADTGSDIVTKLLQKLRDQQSDETLAKRLAAFMDTYNAVYFGQEDKMEQLKELDREIKILLSSAPTKR